MANEKLITLDNLARFKTRIEEEISGGGSSGSNYIIISEATGTLTSEQLDILENQNGYVIVSASEPYALYYCYTDSMGVLYYQGTKFTTTTTSSGDTKSSIKIMSVLPSDYASKPGYYEIVESVVFQTYSTSQINNLVSSLKANAFIKVDTDTYSTLDSFLSSTGEEGYIYLYPIDTSDLTQGYYQYIYEDSAWLSLGTTELNLSNYVDLNSAQSITGVKTFTGSGSNGQILAIENSDTSSYPFYIGKTQYSNLGIFYNGTRVAQLSNVGVLKVSSFEGNLLPLSSASQNLGSSSYKWQNLYLSNDIYLNGYDCIGIDSSNSVNLKYNGEVRIKVGSAESVFVGKITPDSSNTYDLGRSGLLWKDLYLSGVLTDGTNSVNIEDLANLIAYAKAQGWIS